MDITIFLSYLQYDLNVRASGGLLCERAVPRRGVRICCGEEWILGENCVANKLNLKIDETLCDLYMQLWISTERMTSNKFSYERNLFSNFIVQ